MNAHTRSSPSTSRAPYLVVDDFLPLELAEALRRGIENHFEKPATHRPATHQVWNYWFVPGQYTYLRTNPDKIMERKLVDDFMEKLRGWALETLGMNEATWPYLSLYVNGCRQGVHNDTTNGRFAFVYSLTRDIRKTTGGQTLVFHEGDLFRKGISAAAAGSDFYTAIEPRFNRLVIFDDRLPHAVEPVDGPMDPLEGRFVMHGHLRNLGLIASGALSADEVTPVILDSMLSFSSGAISRIRLYNGFLILRLEIAADGTIDHCRPLVDRVIAHDANDVSWDELCSEILARFKALKFPAATGPTQLIQPILFGAG